MANFIDDCRFEKTLYLIGEGETVRSIAKKAGISRGTAAKMKREFLEEAASPEFNLPVLCQCGKQSDHRGWCSWRYAKSPARQATMKRLHALQRPRRPTPQ